MRSALSILCLLVSAASAWADEPEPSQRVFVEIDVQPPRPFVHQPFRVALVFGVERPWFREHAVQLFRQPLDLPLEIRAPWATAIPGTRALEDSRPNPGEGERIALNGGPARATPGSVREVGGRSFDVFRFEQLVVADTPGEIPLAAPALRFAHATRFEEDFVGGRVPLDREDVRVAGAAHTVVIGAFPERGRPNGFVDAVGQFRIEAETDREVVDVGERFLLRITIRGPGNIRTFTAPDLRNLDGLHVYGVQREVLDAESVRLRADVAVTREDVSAVPPIPFAFFDPGPPAGYVVVRTQPQPLRVSSTAGPEARGKAKTGEGPRPGDGPPAAPWWLFVVSILTAAVLVAYAWAHSRGGPVVHEGPDAPTEEAGRIERTAAALRDLDEGTSAEAQGRALAAFLAAHLACRPAAVVGPDLAMRLRARGVDASLAQRTAETLEALVAARYGGPAPTWDPALIDALLTSLSKRVV